MYINSIKYLIILLKDTVTTDKQYNEVNAC